MRWIGCLVLVVVADTFSMIPARRAINFPFVSKHLSHSPNPNLNPYTLALRATPPSVLEFFDEDDETSVEGSKTTSSSSSIISEVVDESDEISEVKTRKAGKARKKKKSTVDEDMFNEFRLRWNQQEREQNSDVVEEKPPPLNDSINTDRFIAVSMDPQSDPRASFLTRISANEGHVKHCQISARMSLEEKQTTNPTPTVVFSHSILSPNLQTEIGQVLCIDATSLTALKSFVSSDPIVSAFGNHDVKIYRWSKETHHLLRADDGKGGYPHMVLSMYKEDKKSQGQANFPSHLDFLKDKRKAITVGGLFDEGVVGAIEEGGGGAAAGAVVGTFLLINAENANEAKDFMDSDPSGQDKFYETSYISRYNKIDCTGKFLAFDKYDKHYISPIEKELQSAGGYEVEKSPWSNW